MVGAAMPLPFQNTKRGILGGKGHHNVGGIRITENIGRWAAEVTMGLQTKRHCVWWPERGFTASHRWGVIFKGQGVGGERPLPLPLLTG